MVGLKVPVSFQPSKHHFFCGKESDPSPIPHHLHPSWSPPCSPTVIIKLSILCGRGQQHQSVFQISQLLQSGINFVNISVTDYGLKFYALPSSFCDHHCKIYAQKNSKTFLSSHIENLHASLQATSWLHRSQTTNSWVGGSLIDAASRVTLPLPRYRKWLQNSNH